MKTRDIDHEAWVSQLYDRISGLLDEGKTRKAQIILEALLPADQAEIFSDLDEAEQKAVLQGLPVEDVADILEKLEDEEVAAIARWLPPQKLAAILDEMEPDEAADLLGDLDPDVAVRILQLMKTCDGIRPLLLHPDETAGGLMTSEYLALGRHMWVERALAAIRNWNSDREYFHYFVVDEQGRLIGVVSLLQLLRAPAKAEVQDVMDRNIISAPLDADQEECARLMSHYDLTALPVVDEKRHLVGVITIDDIVDVIEEEATEDIQKMAGSAPLDKPYLLTSAWYVARSRVGWLLILFVTSMLTANVLKHFEGTLSKMVSLSFFIPMLIGTGGNAGSQTTATIIRALGVGEVDKRDALKVLWHEVQVGLVLGALVGAVGFLRAWSFDDNVAMGITIAVAMFLIVFWANSVGALLPIFATVLGVDPALISGPMMSTLVDATGLFIYLTVARWILHL